MPASNVPWVPPLTRLNPVYPGQIGVHGAWTDTGLRQDQTGTIFWVNPNCTYAEDGQDGTDPTHPMATVAAALTKCQPYRNDVIVVSPNAGWQYADKTVGYTTQIAEEVTVTVPGVRIMGLAPSSALGVVWVPVTDSGVCITVEAMDVLIEGFCFSNEAPAVATPTAIHALWNSAAGVLLFGDNLTVRDCYFGNNMSYGIQLDYSWHVDIHDNRFDNLVTAAIHNPSVHGEPDYGHIYNNDFLDCADAIDLPDVQFCRIHGNRIKGSPAVANSFISLTGGSHNVVSNNWFGCTLAGNQYNTTCSDSGSGMWIRNHCVDGETGAAPT